ncbi:MAG: hypothetical protein LAT83_14885 [Kiritimatiellae bacterium]|nr:hypothetical protein [Kiritimatiellia bacterium]
MQPFPMLFLAGFFGLAGVSGCATRPGLDTTARKFPAGYYRFDAPFVYEGLARVTPNPHGASIQLLENFDGRFELHLRGDHQVVIRNDEMDYPGFRRNFKGSGKLTAPGTAKGDAEIWNVMVGGFSRDHRKGPWTLRPATTAEVERHEQRQRTLEARKRRAGMIE